MSCETELNDAYLKSSLGVVQTRSILELCEVLFSFGVMHHVAVGVTQILVHGCPMCDEDSLGIVSPWTHDARSQFLWSGIRYNLHDW